LRRSETKEPSTSKIADCIFSYICKNKSLRNLNLSNNELKNKEDLLLILSATSLVRLESEEKDIANLLLDENKGIFSSIAEVFEFTNKEEKWRSKIEEFIFDAEFSKISTSDEEPEPDNFIFIKNLILEIIKSKNLELINLDLSGNHSKNFLFDDRIYKLIQFSTTKHIDLKGNQSYLVFNYLKNNKKPESFESMHELHKEILSKCLMGKIDTENIELIKSYLKCTLLPKMDKSLKNIKQIKKRKMMKEDIQIYV